MELDGGSVSHELEAIGETLEPLQLGDPEAPVLPVKRTDVGPGLPLDGRCGPLRVELEEEGPVARAPLEEWVWVATLLGEVEVVITRRDLGQQVSEPASDLLAVLGLRA